MSCYIFLYVLILIITDWTKNLPLSWVFVIDADDKQYRTSLMQYK